MKWFAKNYYIEKSWLGNIECKFDGYNNFGNRHIFRGCGRAGDQSGHHASSDRVADRVHPAAWSWTSKSREQRICRCTGFHRKLPE